MITFSLRPTRSSFLPLIAASVRTRVVSWNEQADKNESLPRAALVIPRINGLAIGNVPCCLIAF